MEKLKRILKPTLIILSLSGFVVGGALIWWASRLDHQITEKLKTKKFLPPTEYFSAPLDFEPGMLAKELKLVLAERSYRSRDKDQKLFPGDWTLLSLDDCQKSMPGALPPETLTCLQWMIRDVQDPEFHDNTFQMAALDSQEKILATYRGNPLTPVPVVFVEAELVAQFLGNEPIMQNVLALGEVPTQCLNALLAIEDSQFLSHSGVSYTGIARAALKNAFGSGVKQGGSTITQQLVKNYFLSSERTLRRKVTEFFMSLILETRVSKDEILETYLNVIYMGQSGAFQVRGFGAASQSLFSKPIHQLNLSECALMAATVASPGLFDPVKKPENAKRRRQLVLDRMLGLEFISPTEHQAASTQGLPVNSRPSVVETAPYYIHAVNQQLKSLLAGIDSEDSSAAGFKIFTGLKLTSQRAAQEALRNQLGKLEIENKRIASLKAEGQTIEGALLSADNRTGLISAVVGGRSYKLTQFNRAIDGHRQVGSIMKPFVYLTALANSGLNGRIYDPLTPLLDEKTTHKFDRQTWTPENYGKKYFGEVPAYFALKNSLNAATASLGIEVGLDRIIEITRKLGVTSKLEKVPALTLGAFELYPREVLEAYTTLARFGNHIDLSYIRSVVSDTGAAVFQFAPLPQQVVEPEASASLVSMMKQTLISGTAKAIRLSGLYLRPAAGKTGTTSDSRDAWFSGFSPRLTTVVWAGYDKGMSSGLTGASGTAPIWGEYMKNYETRYPESDFAWPETTEVVPWTEADESSSMQVDLVFKKGSPHSR
jgi:penicillin-binding protein 1B